MHLQQLRQERRYYQYDQAADQDGDGAARASLPLLEDDSPDIGAENGYFGPISTGDVTTRPENYPSFMNCPSQPPMGDFAKVYARDSDSYHFAKNIFSGLMDDANYPLWKIGSCKQPSAMFNLMDYRRPSDGKGYHYASKTHLQNANFSGWRHSNSSNILYFDGHVGTVKKENLKTDTSDKTEPFYYAV